MLIDSLSIDQGPAVYYDDAFRVVLESYLTSLINDGTTRQISIDQQQAYKYEGDFFGLLASYNIPAYMHWLIMRMNALTSPMDSDKSIYALLIPDDVTVDYIRQSYMSTSRIVS